MNDFRDLYQAICADLSKLPMRFSVAGMEYEGFPQARFPRLSAMSATGEDRERTRIRADAGDGLIAEVDVAYYPSFGAVEWTVWFENAGNADSPVLSNVRDADILFEGDAPVLRGILGDHENDYRPYARDLTREKVRFFSNLGRPTHIYFPYFNLECGNGGCLTAIGWGGTWEATFEYLDGNTRFTGRSTNGLHTYLKPGEKIRTALMVFVPYTGRDEDEAMNVWRRWYIRHNMPRVNGEILRPLSTTGIMGDTGLPNSDGSISERYFTWKPSLSKMLSEGIHMDYRWFDAGWYTDPYGKTVPEKWWHTVGTWEIDPEKWPGDSFRESTDFARQHGMKTLLWFEPERVTHVDALCDHYGYKREWALGDPDGEACGNDIGQPECLAWTIGRVLAALEKGGVEMYREDNNFDSRPCWAARDRALGENRTGITENKAVVGHYALWDAILEWCALHGGNTFIDSCSSGGGRNDLESMRRAVPLLRSDADRTQTSLRLSMTTAFDRWIPFCGASCVERKEQLEPGGRRDGYVMRASYLPVLNLNAEWTQDPNTDFELIRWALAEWRAINPYMLSDFYVLTPWRSMNERDGWTAYAYWDAEKQTGIIQAFRMEQAESDSCTVNLKWLAPDSVYRLLNRDGGVETEYTGRELYALTLRLPDKRAAVIYHIRKVS